MTAKALRYPASDLFSTKAPTGAATRITLESTNATKSSDSLIAVANNKTSSAASPSSTRALAEMSERNAIVSYASIPSGFSTSRLNAFISRAPSAPSMARWSKLPVALITVAICRLSLMT